jgi:hypothetical protein
MGFLKDVVGTIGKVASPLASFIPGGSLVTGGLGALSSLLGGGGVGGAAQAGLTGLLGGAAGQNAGMDPALMAMISTMMGGQLGEQKAQREAAQKAMDYRNQMLTRGLGQAEQVWGAQEPLRQMGMGGLSSFWSGQGGPRGIFQTPETAGDISAQPQQPMGFMAGLQMPSFDLSGAGLQLPDTAPAPVAPPTPPPELDLRRPQRQPRSPGTVGTPITEENRHGPQRTFSEAL